MWILRSDRERSCTRPDGGRPICAPVPAMGCVATARWDGLVQFAGTLP